MAAFLHVLVRLGSGSYRRSSLVCFGLTDSSALRHSRRETLRSEIQKPRDPAGLLGLEITATAGLAVNIIMESMEEVA